MWYTILMHKHHILLLFREHRLARELPRVPPEQGVPLDALQKSSEIVRSGTHESLNLLSHNVDSAFYQRVGLDPLTAAKLGINLLLAPAAFILGIAATIGITRWGIRKAFGKDPLKIS